MLRAMILSSRRRRSDATAIRRRVGFRPRPRSASFAHAFQPLLARLYAGSGVREQDTMIRSAIAAALMIGSVQLGPGGMASAQPIGPIGPPIPPEQVFRQQPMPAPPPPAAVSPPGSSGRASPPVVTPPRADQGVRVARCQHQAAVQRVPMRDRGSYVHSCSIGRD